MKKETRCPNCGCRHIESQKNYWVCNGCAGRFEEPEVVRFVLENEFDEQAWLSFLSYTEFMNDLKSQRATENPFDRLLGPANSHDPAVSLLGNLNNLSGLLK